LERSLSGELKGDNICRKNLENSKAGGKKRMRIKEEEMRKKKILTKILIAKDGKSGQPPQNRDK